jgi:hypothetical protein
MMHYSIMKKKKLIKIIASIFLMVVLLFSYFFLIKNFNEKKVFTENNSIIKLQVPKGTFKNAETGEIFSYVDNQGYLVGCGLSNCKNVYFDVDLNGNIIQIRYANDNPIIGKILSFTIDKDKPETVNYTVEYKYKDKIHQSIYTTELCIYFKGGGKQCYSPSIKDTPIMVILNPQNDSLVDNIIIFNKIFKAYLLNIVNVDHV